MICGGPHLKRILAHLQIDCLVSRRTAVRVELWSSCARVAQPNHQATRYQSPAKCIVNASEGQRRLRLVLEKIGILVTCPSHSASGE